ncbi:MULTISPECIES: response regulator [Niastella]|uniref:Response regulator n=1 Tax=Niastella soli TaxID=2821487 RepID=A0ABS3YZ01_9BACT|nr:response regulator [Niastella soli]MBO9202963.1 response regulator [Niastella soli]
MNKTYILVDDDSDDRELFTLALHNVAPAIHLHCFKNGSEAIQHLKTFSTTADLIFLDLNMPVMDGWECITQLKQDISLKHIPVIIYTTSSNEKDIQRAREAGAKCYFIKPDDFATLNKTLSLITENVQANCFGSIARNEGQRQLECFS